MLKINSQKNLQYLINSTKYSGNPKPSQTFQISPSHQNVAYNNNIISKSKQTFQISSNNKNIIFNK